MRHVTAAVLFLSLLSGLPALAAPKPSHAWQLIAKNENERIALDKARISRLPNGNTTAWSRLSLGFDIPDPHSGLRYTTIEALNSYNCKKREYMTLKRIYVDAKGKPVREEKVSNPRAVAIEAGSFEEKMLPEVCKPRSVDDMKQIAEQLAAVLSQPADAPAKATTKAPAAAATKTAQATGAQTAKATPVASSDDKSAPKTAAATGKPRMIDLPKIDPAQVDNPPQKSIKPNVTKAEPVAADKAAPAQKAEEASPAAAPQKAAPAAAKPRAAPNYHTGAVSRAEIERQLATFGPRKPRATTAAKEKSKPADLPTHWSYDGKGGPEFWSHISPDNKACADGKRQSPIDISDGIRVDLEPIQFNYGVTSYSVIDNGHTVQVNIPEGAGISIMGRNYQLLQFHFHKPAEERVNGRSFDMVAHFVHKDADGNLAVVAVLMEKGPEHPLVQAIWNNLPLEQGMLMSPSKPIDLSNLLPEKRDYWTYMGSLTTPPCTEGVLWMVMKQPVLVSLEQIAIFGRLYPHNARPIQPSNNRLIKESR